MDIGLDGVSHQNPHTAHAGCSRLSRSHPAAAHQSSFGVWEKQKLINSHAVVAPGGRGADETTIFAFFSPSLRFGLGRERLKDLGKNLNDEKNYSVNTKPRIGNLGMSGAIFGWYGEGREADSNAVNEIAALRE